MILSSHLRVSLIVMNGWSIEYGTFLESKMQKNETTGSGVLLAKETILVTRKIFVKCLGKPKTIVPIESDYVVLI